VVALLMQAVHVGRLTRRAHIKEQACRFALCGADALLAALIDTTPGVV